MEVAGLVLAVVPIVIEALKYYKEAKTLLNRYRSKNEEIAALIQELDYYRFSINEQVAKVLMNAGVPSISEVDLRSGQAAAFLKDPLRNDEVIGHMGGERFNLFIRQLNLCQEALAGIISQFDGLIAKPKDGAIQDGSDALRRLIISNQLSRGRPWEVSGKRLKFSLKKPELESKIHKLARATEKLRDPDLQAPRQFLYAEAAPEEVSSRQLRALSMAFEHVQCHAGRLYSALTSTLPRLCHLEHNVRLFLDDRIEVLQRRRRRKACFRIDLLGLNNGTIETWHRCIVETTSDGVHHDKSLENDYETSDRFDRQVSLEITASESSLQQIQTFCFSIQDAASHGGMCNLQLSDRGTLHYARGMRPAIVSPARASDMMGSKSAGGITLETVIERAKDPALPERNWSLKQRMILALRLACSLLQLNRTQWLSGGCRSESIFFQPASCRNEAVNGARPPFEADQPYMARSDPPGFEHEVPTEHAHPLLLDLSIVLMEIWTVVAFRHRVKDRTPPDSYRERHELADLWLREIEESMLPNYKRAVWRCIDGASRTSYSFENSDFREDFCEGVVKPLWLNCQPWLR